MMNFSQVIRIPASLLAMVVVLSLVGCGRGLNIEYGQSRGVAGDQSINGFGVLRRTYQNSGWTTREVNRLNDRLSKVNAIVWLPQYRDSLYDDATLWFDTWLGEETRTLVYIVPDDGCEIRYYEAARQLAPNDQQLEYRRRIARLESDQLINRLGEESAPTNGWFSLERLADTTTVGSGGQWNVGASDQQPNSPTGQFVGDALVSYKVISAPAAASSGSTSTTVTPPSAAFPKWHQYAASTVEVEHTTLLSANDGSPVIVRVTADKWGDSKLIVVGSGSLLCNFSMTTPQGQAIASQLIAETNIQPGAVGFLTTDYSGAPVSDVDPEINAMTGTELFKVWPLSLIMLHLAAIGFIACMILLPIFGRPQEVQSATSSDFADHLDAVALLMNKSGGEEFARRRVSDYMRRIHGETSGPWVLPDPKPETTSAVPPSSDNIPAPSAIMPAAVIVPAAVTAPVLETVVPPATTAATPTTKETP